MDWSKAWQMPFDVAKCNVMHMGFHNANFNYTIIGSDLADVNQQRDLGVLTSKNLKWDAQVNESYKTAIAIMASFLVTSSAKRRT